MKKSKILITLLLSIILSCSNPLEQKKDETTDIKKDTSVSQKEIEKHNKNALETQSAAARCLHGDGSAGPPRARASPGPGAAPSVSWDRPR